MEKIDLIHWARNIAEQEKFTITKKIYQANYYSEGNLRVVIFLGKYQGQKAALKVYNDPRPTIEPLALKAFRKKNKSQQLTTPVLYAFGVESLHRGWFIMEQLEDNKLNFKSPLSLDDRKKFLNLFLEYRQNFPVKPGRELMLAEHLKADDFHLLRIMRWFELANNKDFELTLKNKPTAINAKRFLPLFSRALLVIRREFSHRSMVWCHGHFKPKEIFYCPSKKVYYLTDFDHNHMYPEGYELAFIIWADYIMTSNWQLPYSKWRQGIFYWIEELRLVAKELKIKKYQQLITASIIERVLGTILADIGATDAPVSKKRKQLNLLCKLLDELLGEY